MNDELYKKIKQIILDSGEILLKAKKENLGIQEKAGIQNFATEYDILIQNKLKKELLEILPEAGFIGEENDAKDNIDNEYIFIVDPIDGTNNFARDIRLSAISIALLKDKEPYMAFCYNPYVNELYEAKKGEGAYLNGERIHVSNKTLKEGIALCGCAPYYSELRERTLEIQTKLGMVASDYRRFGSAVIEICAIASGKAEMYFELKLMPWDYAAACLILTEAGGIIKTIDNKDIQYFESTSILASNGVEDYFKYI